MITEFRYGSHPNDVRHYLTESLRQEFLIDKIFIEDEISVTYTLNDRLICGGAYPMSKSLTLSPTQDTKSEYFLERREIGIINLGGSGTISVDGVNYVLDQKDALYIGKGNKTVRFSSDNPNVPAKFYFNSSPAHMSYPTVLVKKSDADQVTLGSIEYSNERKINKLIIQGIVQTCQLQMGLTEINTGSVWNTMPPHTHTRRSELYFYFDLPQDNSVCHFMGLPSETRHIWVKNEQAVISPSWSIHAGAGTSNYSFIWGMAGENLDYSDMDAAPIHSLM
ncbi:MAG: 5-dehydro-4-deoxy-D-glucuronate isomerase [Saprospiraceae bacterium]